MCEVPGRVECLRNWNELQRTNNMKLVVAECGHIGHDYCVRRVLRAQTFCPRCRFDLGLVAALTGTSKRPGVVSMQGLRLLKESLDLRNYTREHRREVMLEVFARRAAHA